MNWPVPNPKAEPVFQDLIETGSVASRIVYPAVNHETCICQIVEKRFVREWAHLRYGLFDENPGPDDNPFYNGFSNGMSDIPLPVG